VKRHEIEAKYNHLTHFNKPIVDEISQLMRESQVEVILLAPEDGGTLIWDDKVIEFISKRNREAGNDD